MNNIAIIRGLEYNIIIETGGMAMEFMSAREAADKWGISQRRVAILCSESRIDNATMVGNMWIIPVTAEKPIDARITRYSQKDGKEG
ncbi:DNA-binding protein [Campylobacter lari]|nr:DNA-binding protein [Campylobacter lari]